MVFNLRFQKSRLLEQIVYKISYHQPSVDAMVDELIKFYPTPVKFNQNNLQGFLGEMYIRTSLKEIKEKRLQEDPSVDRRVVLDYIPQNNPNSKYLFTRTKNGTVVVSDDKEENKAEYDYLLKVDNTLVVCEIKLASDKSHIKPIFREWHINKLFDPLIDIQNNKTKFGYLVVLPRNKIYSNSHLRSKIRFNGGIILSFPMPLQEWKEFVLEEILPAYRMKTIGF